MPREKPKSEPTERKIRVLIADDRPETQQSLRKLLQFEGDIEVVGVAATGEESLKQTEALKPDIVLMDINMPDIDGITATERITKQFSFAQVIMMSVHTDADSVRRSMLAGARDFIAKPFTTNTLTASVRRVYELETDRRASFEQAVSSTKVQPAAVESAPPKGKLITVFSPKGGTGASTIAVNLAVALQKAGNYDVALVDANLQFGDIAILLDLQPQHSMADLIPEIAYLDEEMVESVMTAHSSGIKALLAPARPELSDLVTPQDIKAILQKMLNEYDFIVVDTKGFLHDSALAFLDVSDRILLISTPDIPSIKSARLFFDVASALHYPEERTRLIVNMADRKGALEVEEIEGSIKHDVLMSVPTDDPGALYAANEGVPLLLSNKKSPLAPVITQLAKGLVEELMPPAEQPEAAAREKAKAHRGGLLGRIF
jgi:pilus assembly protein CpaE